MAAGDILGPIDNGTFPNLDLDGAQSSWSALAAGACVVRAAYDGGVSDAVQHSGEAPHGTSLLPRDLTENQLASAPVLVSIDALLIEDLSDDEDDAFAAALES
jgi:hypothetical protein